MRTLIAGGVKPDATSRNGQPLLHRAVAKRNHEMVDLLLAAKAPLNTRTKEGHTTLMVAAEVGPVGLVRTLLAHGADPNARTEDMLGGGWGDMTPVHGAAVNNAAAVITLLHRHGAEIDARVAQGSTALKLAAEQGHIDVVRALLAAGADRTLGDEDGDTARDVAKTEEIHALVST